MDEILNKKARITVQVLIKDKNRKLLQEKLSENKGKPKELWKIEFTRQKRSHSKHLPPYEKRVDVFSRAIANIFKKYFANLASDLVKKLPGPVGKFGIPSVCQLQGN